MACIGCQKAKKARGGSVYLECPVCETVLHGRKKDMPKIGDTLVCGQCYKKYKQMLALVEKAQKPSKKAKKIKTED